MIWVIFTNDRLVFLHTGPTISVFGFGYVGHPLPVLFNYNNFHRAYIDIPLQVLVLLMQ